MAFGDREQRARNARAMRERAQEKARGRAAERPRQPLKRSSGLSRGSGPARKPRPERPPEGPLTAGEWRRTVWMLDLARCRVSLAGPFRLDDEWAWDAHHVIPKQWLRGRGLHHLVWDSRNGIVLARRVHERHELAVERVPYAKLPRRVFEFAAEIGPHAEGLLGPPLYPRPADPGNDEEVA